MNDNKIKEYLECKRCADNERTLKNITWELKESKKVNIELGKKFVLYYEQHQQDRERIEVLEEDYVGQRDLINAQQAEIESVYEDRKQLIKDHLDEKRELIEAEATIAKLTSALERIKANTDHTQGCPNKSWPLYECDCAVSDQAIAREALAVKENE